MAETFTLSELVIPGTYIRVSAEALIPVGGVSTGNIGIVGTGAQAVGRTVALGNYPDAQSALGDYEAGEFNLVRGVELLYQTGARQVYARALDPGAAGQDDYIAAFNELVKDDVNILVAPQLPTAQALTVFSSVAETAENSGKDVIAVVGSDAPDREGVLAQVQANDRVVLTTPGIMGYDAAADVEVALSGNFSAAAVAGLLSTLAPQNSPTNKVLSGVSTLARRYSYAETRDLVDNGVMVLEQRQGVRVVRGITTDDGAFRQVTTRRITDFAKAGIRAASNPFIGRLNNLRVRAALQGAIDGFLTTMVIGEALTGYTLAVTATRADEINGRAIVNAVLQPTFSIDFVAVTLVLQ